LIINKKFLKVFGEKLGKSKIIYYLYYVIKRDKNYEFTI
jgi:hypothetical protein